MRVILVLWFIPILLFGGWYSLSLNDVNFGFFFLERQFHDLIFMIYGNMLNMPPEEVPALIAGVFAVDTLAIFGIAAVRWHRHWVPHTVGWVKSVSGYEQELNVAEPAEVPTDELAQLRPAQTAE